MSAFKKINCSFKDQNILITALKNIGYNPVVYQDKHNLRGYQNDQREEQAEIIVPKSEISQASNDLGFSFDHEKKEYLMICSEYDVHLGIADKVKQSYAITAIKSALVKNKFVVNSEVKDRGKVILTAGKIL